MNTLSVRVSRSSALSLLLTVIFAGGVASQTPTFSSGESLGTYDPPNSEISGLAASRTSPGVLWAHADSGDSPRCFALSEKAERLATFNLTNATHTDWEDMEIGPGPVSGVSYIYIADIGDNGTSRCSVRIYRFPEPVVYPRYSASPISKDVSDSTWEVINLKYPGIICIGNTEITGAQNAETVMVDSRNGDLYIGSKSDSTFRVFRAPASSLVANATVSMTEVANINIGWRATGGTIQRDGREILVRGQIPNGGGGALVWWPLGNGQTVGDAIAATRYNVPFQPEPQGEAVCFDRNGDGYYTLSEGGNPTLWYFRRLSNDGPTPEAFIITPESNWRYLNDGSDQGTAWRGPEFDDSTWSSGPAQMGYGDGDEQTVLSFGGNASDKHRTYYFRKDFQRDAGVDFESLNLRILYESGAAVYVNGVEVLRSNLAAVANAATLASGSRGVVKKAWHTVPLDESVLVDGQNTVAVELHLSGPAEGDLSFDLQVDGRIRSYDLEVSENMDEGGEVVVTPATNAPVPGRYLNGTTLSLDAQPLEGYQLQHWLVFDPAHPGDLSFATVQTGNPFFLSMTSNREVQAVWIASTSEGEGTVEGVMEGEGVVEGVTEGEGLVEGLLEGEGVAEGEGSVEGLIEGEGVAEGEGSVEGGAEGEGLPEGEGAGEPEGEVDGEGIAEGSTEAEGATEGATEGTPDVDGEGAPDGEGAADGEGGTEGSNEAEGSIDGEGSGDGEGDGDGEGTSEGEGSVEGIVEGEGRAEGEGEQSILELLRQLLFTFASAETSGDRLLTLAEIVLQLPSFTQEALDDADANNDDRLSVAELLEATGGGIIMSTDINADFVVQLSELLRLIQFYNASRYYCANNAGASEDGFVVAPPGAEPACVLHSVDQDGDKVISLSELLRGIQLYNLGGFTWCPGGGTEDGFCG